MTLKISKECKKIKPIGKNNYNSMNTMKGILVILPLELIFDQYVNLIKWDLYNKIWINIDKNLNKNE